MNEAFWGGFEKQAGLLQAVGSVGGLARGSVQRAGTALRTGSSAAGEAITRGAIQARQGVSSGYRAGQRKALGMSPKQYGEMRRGPTAVAKAAPAAAAAAPAAAPGLAQRGLAAARANPLVTAGAVGAAGVGAGILAGHRPQPQQGQAI
jgi:hypothetical protein